MSQSEIKPDAAAKPVIEPIKPMHSNMENHEHKLVKKLPQNNLKEQLPVLVIVGLVIIGLGFGSGWAIAGISKASDKPVANVEVNDNNVATSEDIEVSEDEFPEIGEGILREGGIDGNGTHSLDRDGDNNVALLSTVLSLDSFIGKRVQVWGKTLSATGDQAGWLVDVTKVKVLK